MLDDGMEVAGLVLEDEDDAGELEFMVLALTSSSSESPSLGNKLMVAPPRRLRLSMCAILLLSCCAVGGNSSVLSMIEIHHLACHQHTTIVSTALRS
jgi:hypothetical protein